MSFFNELKELGEQLIANPQASERYKICSHCPSFEHETHKCKECGCNMKYKVFVPFVSCPLKHW
jgi:hypothetical protein